MGSLVAHPHFERKKSGFSKRKNPLLGADRPSSMPCPGQRFESHSDFDVARTFSRSALPHQ